MIRLTKTVQAKLEKFLEDAEIQSRFSQALEKVSIYDIIRPQNNPGSCGAEFQVKIRGFSAPYPLLDDELRIHFIERKINVLLKREDLDTLSHILIYFYLALYQKNFKVASPARTPTRKKVGKKATRKKTTRKTGGANDPREKRQKRLHGRLQRIINKLTVPPSLKKSRTPEALLDALLWELRLMDSRWLEQKGRLETLTREVAMYRDPDYMHPEIKRTMNEFIDENTRNKIALNREMQRANTLEREVNHLAEQIISLPLLSQDQHSEEVDSLRREYSALSQKYDALVNKNIDLVNRLEKMEKAKSLDQILDMIRDKINGVIRAGVRESDSVLLKKIESEVEQLKRFRLYLGRALYDVGVLYLRIGRKGPAIREFRAARELGIEDSEINRLLNT